MFIKWLMNMFKFVQCSKNDVRVRSMFDKMVVFDTSLIKRSTLVMWKIIHKHLHETRHLVEHVFQDVWFHQLWNFSLKTAVQLFHFLSSFCNKSFAMTRGDMINHFIMRDTGCKRVIQTQLSDQIFCINISKPTKLWKFEVIPIIWIQFLSARGSPRRF